MKLNPDCIRDILFVVEENTSFNQMLRLTDDNMFGLESKYQHDEILYHVRQCQWLNLLDVEMWTMTGDCLIKDLTPLGHEFIANVRKNEVWTNVKNIAGQIGSASLSALVQIASNVVTNLIKSQFSITS